ncbi:MAG: ATPase, T2SS/T4P/T4SS family [Candidatus Eremiobacterota bacterium]
MIEDDLDELLRQEGKGMSDILDFTQAAELLKISHPTLYRWLGEAKIKGFKAGKQWRFYRKDLIQFMQTEGTEESGDYSELNKTIEFFIQRLKNKHCNLPQKIIDYETDALLYLIIMDGLSEKATDIHLNPLAGDNYELFYRIKGKLSKITDMSCVIIPFLLREINRAFRLIGSIRKGRMIFKGDTSSEIRISVIETLAGEKYTMKLFDMTDVITTLSVCLKSEEDVNEIRAMLSKSSGLILVSGPPQSGRTTLVYSMLQEKIDSSLNIMTVEEHIEYILDGVSQIQIDHDYEEIFNSVMDSDPDIIMTGEVRNSDRASLCVTASGTKLVIAQIMARNAGNALQRLYDMGIEPSSLGSVLIGITSEKLYKIACPLCREEYLFDEGMMEDFPGLFSSPSVLVRAHGCENCNYSGYKGYYVIYEIFSADEELRNMIVNRRNMSDIRHKSIEKGMKTFHDQSMEMLKNRVITLEEFMRVTGFEYRKNPVVY